MGFRDKMKKAVGRTADDDKGPTLAKSAKDGVDVYKPGETPPSKYRGNWNKEHHEKLHAFSFGDTFGRRKSSYSDVSPGGTRRSSWIGFGKKEKQPHEPSGVGQVMENAESDDEPANVGKSRPHTADNAPAEGDDDKALDQQKTITNGNAHESSNDLPFTQDELTKALTATKLKNNEDEGGEGVKEGVNEGEK